MPDLSLPVHVEMLTPLAEPARRWCPDCQLPSVLAWAVAFEAGSDFTVRDVTVCTDCGREDWT